MSHPKTKVDVVRNSNDCMQVIRHKYEKFCTAEVFYVVVSKRFENEGRNIRVAQLVVSARSATNRDEKLGILHPAGGVVL